MPEYQYQARVLRMDPGTDGLVRFDTEVEFLDEDVWTQVPGSGHFTTTLSAKELNMSVEEAGGDFDVVALAEAIQKEILARNLDAAVEKYLDSKNAAATVQSIVEFPMLIALAKEKEALRLEDVKQGQVAIDAGLVDLKSGLPIKVR
jgi:hypothetical protein